MALAGSLIGAEFIRKIDIESRNIQLKIHQYSVGDVGCVVWDAGIVLGKFLDYAQIFKNSSARKSVIDIGSGTGVVGLYAAALGANVILTDLPGLLPLLEKNIHSNKNVLNGSATSAVLSWGEDSPKFVSPDILLISDCIYYDMSVEKLIPTIVALSSEKTDIFISYEDRENKRKLIKQFLSELKKWFDIRVIPSSELHPDFHSPDIHVLKCKKHGQKS